MLSCILCHCDLHISPIPYQFLSLQQNAMNKKRTKNDEFRVTAIKMRSLRCDVVGVWLLRIKKTSRIYSSIRCLFLVCRVKQNSRKIDIKIKRMCEHKRRWISSLSKFVTCNCDVKKFSTSTERAFFFGNYSHFFLRVHSWTENLEACSFYRVPFIFHIKLWWYCVCVCACWHI